MVNEKMTAIANKIRSMMGIEDKMGLDAMATYLETEQTNIANAYTAISSKGVSVPDTPTSLYLAPSIEAIKVGVTVQVESGSFSTDGLTGKATVECGFKPDVVVITMNESYNGVPLNAAIDFNSIGKEKSYISLWSSNQTYILWTLLVTRTTTGFTIEAYVYSSDWSSTKQKKNFNFKAVKYTE